MRSAADPWWIIGSAAVVLHGAHTRVADVDVLLSVRDAEAMGRRLGIDMRPGDGAGPFRSDRYGRWQAPPVPVEFMAGLVVRERSPVHPRTRTTANVETATVYLPAREEMIAILELFDRPKDRARAAMLRARDA